MLSVSPTPEKILQDPSKWQELFDLKAWTKRHYKPVHQPEIFACARVLRSQYKRVGAVGFCFGGWAVFQLGAKGNDLVDCISTAHPTWLEKSEIEKVGVPVQILAPEHDAAYSPELKKFSLEVIPTLGIPFDYQFFPGVVHAFATRGDEKNPAERRAMVSFRGTNIKVGC